MEQIAVTIEEARRVLSCGRTSLYRLINEGKLVRRHIGRRALITTKSIRALLDEPSAGGGE